MPGAVTPPTPPSAADWRDLPQTPGDWRWSSQDPGVRSRAEFGNVLSVACLRSGLIRLVIANHVGAITIRTTALTRTIAANQLVQTSANEGATTAVDLPATDPVLDAMAFSRGRFALDMGGKTSLVVPSWPEIGRVVEDCR